MRKNKYIIPVLLLCLVACSAAPVKAQRINFGLYASDGIILQPGSVDELNFNFEQPLIVAGNTVAIDLNDQSAGIITITGRADLDITVRFDVPPYLSLDAENNIPLSAGFAYSNSGAPDEETARMQSVPLPPGFNVISFQLLRRLSGPPGPPPTPPVEGYTAPTAVAYLFVYGTLGPVPAEASAGLYNGTINIYVEYSTGN